MVLKTKKNKASAPKREGDKSKPEVKKPRAVTRRKLAEKPKVIYSDWASI